MEVAHVFVPGLGLDGRSSAHLRRLVPGRVVLLPGMGLAAPVPSVEVLAAHLRSELDDGPVMLIGHSQSCQVVAAAGTDPRVTAIVLLGPTTDPRLRSVRGLVGRWLWTAAHEPVRSVPRILAQWWTTGPRSMAALWRRAAPDGIERRLAEVPVPVVVVRGTHDRLCPHDWAVRVAAAAPRGRLVEISGAAHLTPQTHPEDVAPIVAGAAGY